MNGYGPHDDPDIDVSAALEEVEKQTRIIRRRSPRKVGSSRVLDGHSPDLGNVCKVNSASGWHRDIPRGPYRLSGIPITRARRASNRSIWAGLGWREMRLLRGERSS